MVSGIMGDKQAYGNTGSINDWIKILMIVTVTALLLSVLSLSEVNAKTNDVSSTMFSESFLRGDLNGNGVSADAGDLVLMKRASIGEIQADSGYDLNNNDQLADAGDLVLMKRASIGEIVLQNPPQTKDKTLYVWAGAQDRKHPDFLAVVNFDEDSPDYGKVIKTVPIPPPGNINNEAHHCHLSANKKILACGGLLSVLQGQNGVFFFNVSNSSDPKFLFSTNAPNSNITDDFLPLSSGGFLVTQMGSASGGAPGRVAEFDQDLQLVHEWPDNPPQDGFNPHGIDARPEINLLVTSDFLNPVTTLNGHGPLEIHGSIRVWDMDKRQIVRTIPIPPGPDNGSVGTIDVKLIPGDPLGRAITAGMLDGLIRVVNPYTGEVKTVFNTSNITPHIEVPPSAGPVPGGLIQLFALPMSGDRLIAGLFQTGQVVMLNTSDRDHFVQLSVVDLGVGAGPHYLKLTEDNKRLVVSDYFLNEDDFGMVHFEGDHKIHVIKVDHDKLTLDTRFDLDFDKDLQYPARPHGLAVK